MKLLVSHLALLLSISIHAQKPRENSIGVSGLGMRSSSEALYFSLGSPKRPNSKTTNYGVNVNYSRRIYKEFYGMLGVGYFKQSFSIVRPFRYTEPIEVLRHTKSYSYRNLYLLAGIKYKRTIINENYKVQGGINYSYLHSYQQNYRVNGSNNLQQTNNVSLPLCDIISLDIGIERKFGKRFSIELDGMLPFYVKWRMDDMFFRYDYSEDSQRAAINNFSIGSMFSVLYHF